VQPASVTRVLHARLGHHSWQQSCASARGARQLNPLAVSARIQVPWHQQGTVGMAEVDFF